MNKLRIASAVAALTSALAIPAWGADATNAAKDGASNIDQPVQQSGTGAAPTDWPGGVERQPGESSEASADVGDG